MSEQRDNRMVKLAELWERVSAKGTRYFAGFLGDCQELLFDAGEKEHPTRPGERVHVWRLMVHGRDPLRRRSQTWDRSRDATPEPQGWIDDSGDLTEGPSWDCD
jgi:hypothetical protein